MLIDQHYNGATSAIERANGQKAVDAGLFIPRVADGFWRHYLEEPFGWDAHGWCALLCAAATAHLCMHATLAPTLSNGAPIIATIDLNTGPTTKQSVVLLISRILVTSLFIWAGQAEIRRQLASVHDDGRGHMVRAMVCRVDSNFEFLIAPLAGRCTTDRQETVTTSCGRRACSLFSLYHCALVRVFIF